MSKKRSKTYLLYNKNWVGREKLGSFWSQVVNLKHTFITARALVRITKDSPPKSIHISCFWLTSATSTHVFLTMYSISLAFGVTSDRNLLCIRTQSLMKSSFSISGKVFAGEEELETTESIQAVTASVTRMLRLSGVETRRLESRGTAGPEGWWAGFTKHSRLQLWENRKQNMSSSQVWRKGFLHIWFAARFVPLTLSFRWFSVTQHLLQHGFLRGYIRLSFELGDVSKGSSGISRNNSPNFYWGSGG